MKKRFLTAAIATALVATTMTAQAEVKVKWFGFAQIKADMKSQLTDDGLTFGADRVRFGFKVKDGNFFAKLQADLNKDFAGLTSSNNQREGTLPQIIKDAVVGWKFNDAAKVSLGQYKTPLGMDFNTSGKKLDIVQRGMEKGLVLERATGAMLSGRKIGGGFGYDVFYGNPSGRGKGYAGGATGSENTTVVRFSYDMGKMMHMEYAYGVDGAPAGANDYKVQDLAIKFQSGPSTAKFEWIDGQNDGGVAGADETVYLLHYGHMLNKGTEVIIRHYAGDSGNDSMGNTYIGVNLFTGSNKTNGRIQLNYVIASGDKATYAGNSKGYTDDAILTQYQVSF